MRMPDLRALAREHGLRDYSRLRKAELIAFLRDNLRPIPSPRPAYESYTCSLWTPYLLRDPLQNLYLLQDPLQNLCLLQNLLLHNRLSFNQSAQDPQFIQSIQIGASFQGGSLQFPSQWKEWDGCGNLP